jgi:hypothetical protein
MISKLEIKLKALKEIRCNLAKNIKKYVLSLLAENWALEYFKLLNYVLANEPKCCYDEFTIISS